MKLENLKPAAGSVKSEKRIGRGEGSGHGGTATRGHKGAKSRSGYSKKVGFEGGQQPLQRRVPKFGFKSPNKVSYKGINISILQNLATNKGINTFDVQVILDNGLASKNDLIKVLGKGSLNDKINVTAHAFSKSAKELIEAKGGSVTTL